jgi:hypothetical protein
VKRAALVVATILATFFTTALPAHAVDWFYRTEPYGRAGYDAATNRFKVEDTTCDGFAVYGRYSWDGVSDGWHKVWDHNCYATDGPVVVTITPPPGVTRIRYQICKWYKEKPDVCSYSNVTYA